jgi:hypothetical protein
LIKKRRREESDLDSSVSKRMKFKTDIDEDDLKVKPYLLMNFYSFLKFLIKSYLFKNQNNHLWTIKDCLNLMTNRYLRRFLLDNDQPGFIEKESEAKRTEVRKL